MPLTKTELIYLIKAHVSISLARHHYSQYLKEEFNEPEWDMKKLIKLTDIQLCEIYLNSRITSIRYPI